MNKFFVCDESESLQMRGDCKPLLFDDRLAMLGEIAYRLNSEWNKRESPWISVEDKLPEEKQSVWVCDNNGGTEVGFFTKDDNEQWRCYREHWISGGGDVLNKIEATHWMPLPEPPERECDESATKERCHCKQWHDGIYAINGLFVFCHNQSTAPAYNEPPFKYCPWCGDLASNSNAFPIKWSAYMERE